MNRTIRLLLAGLAAMGLWGTELRAQRAGAEGPKEAGTPAKVLYKQDFEEEGVVDGFKDVVGWTDEPASAFGSKGSLKVGAQAGERYMKWANEDTTIVFMSYVHGFSEPYFMAGADKAGKNLHGYFKVGKQDTWELQRIKADSLVGFGGGASSPGETFRNFLFYSGGSSDKKVEAPYMLIDKIVIFSGPDGKPPSAPPTNVKANWYGAHKAVSINWKEAVDDVGVYAYEVHRSEAQGFTPAKETRVAAVNDTYYEDNSVQAGKTYYYKIVGKDLGGYAIASDEMKYESKESAGGGSAGGSSSSGKGEF